MSLAAPNPSLDVDVFRFAQRMGRLKASAIREILKVTEMPDVISFAGGLPAPELFPVAQFGQACQEVLAEDGPAALQYSVTEGYLPLRHWICDYLARTNNIQCTPDHVLIISGSQQGLDLIGKVLLDPGDSVIIENPAYLGAIQSFDAYEANYINVATDEDGIVTSDLVRVLREVKQKPKLLYLVPNFQNPSGITLTLQRRQEVVAIAAEHGIPIFEDDPYGRLRYSGEAIPSLTALAQSRNCIYISTVSKTIAWHARRLARDTGPSRVRKSRARQTSRRLQYPRVLRSARCMRTRANPASSKNTSRRCCRSTRAAAI